MSKGSGVAELRCKMVFLHFLNIIVFTPPVSLIFIFMFSEAFSGFFLILPASVSSLFLIASYILQLTHMYFCIEIVPVCIMESPFYCGFTRRFLWLFFLFLSRKAYILKVSPVFSKAIYETRLNSFRRIVFYNHHFGPHDAFIADLNRSSCRIHRIVFSFKKLVSTDIDLIDIQSS